MKIAWNQKLRQQPRLIFEEAGYHAFTDPNTGAASFVMRLGRGHYPRFHAYVKVRRSGHLEISLHLDQKQACYEGQTAHAGEYEGAQINEEAARITRWLAYYTAE
ncbi:MAG: hypothetical protein ABIG66_03175 [Candidatus Kerfeldbacteria bacterium]